MKQMIQTKNLCRGFAAGQSEKNMIYPVKDLSVEIPEHSLVILKGRSGSGKTTLLNLLSGLDQPTEGEVFFRGRKYADMSVKEQEKLRRTGMGFVFQSVALVPEMTAFENVDFAMRLARVRGKRAEKEERIRYLLTRVGLEKRMFHLPSQLSGGERQRVAIARAMAHRPEIVFADEPTGALDTASGQGVMTLFRELVDEEGITVVMTTHDTELMKQGDRIIEMEGSL